jgi:DNA (cytosine-5)-methyltransferase 1
MSKAGKQAGMEKGSGTRSGMLWQVERILEECKDDNSLPNILLMENVPDVIGSKNVKNFAKWLEKLECLGYKNYWKLLNAKDYGIPQNRNRCFMVSLLGDYDYTFPQEIKLEKRLKDMLEKNVDEKFYLSSKMINYIGSKDKENKINNSGTYQVSENSLKINREIGVALNTRTGQTRAANSILENRKVIEGEFYDVSYSNARIREIENGLDLKTKNKLDADICPTITTTISNLGMVVKQNSRNLKQQLCDNLIQNGKVQENDVIRHSYTKSRMNGQMKDIQENNMCPTLDTRCDCLGIVVQEPTAYDEQNQYLRKDGCIGTLTTDGGSPKHNNRIIENNYRIRKLTPRETWRLMGVKDCDFDKVSKNQSNASLYHLAGDSIVTNVLCAIFKQML